MVFWSPFSASNLTSLPDRRDPKPVPGVGKTTVKAAKKVEAADPAIADEVLAGKKSLGEATREIRERELGVTRVAQPMKGVVQERQQSASTLDP